MCGRYTLASPEEWIRDEFDLAEVPPDYRPRYNIAPTQEVAVLVLRDGAPRLEWFRWGLIPSWARDPALGNRLANARAETVHEKPSFRAAFARRRCLVLADGFYEWRRTASGKVPMRIRLASGRPFALAGLWEYHAPPGAEPVLSCTIVTTAASAFMQPIHERMPVILPAGSRERWLDPATDRDALRDLLHPYGGDDLEAYEVSTLVNSPRNDRPECIAPA